MAVAAGTRSWAVYRADTHGTLFGDSAMAVNVPTEFTAGGNPFGWTLVADEGSAVDTADRRLTFRHVVGVSSDGHRAKAIVPDVASDIWTGAATEWTDTKSTTFVVTGYVGEKRTRAR